MPFHKVLVLETVELSKCPAREGERETPQHGTPSRPVSPSRRRGLAQTFISLQGADLLPMQIPLVALLARGYNSGHLPVYQILLSWKTEKSFLFSPLQNMCFTVRPRLLKLGLFTPKSHLLSSWELEGSEGLELCAQMNQEQGDPARS